MLTKTLLSVSLTLALASPALAAHPLITDDTGTQGMGHFQLEINGEVSFDEEEADGVTVEETASEVAAVVSYGITEKADMVIGIPYQRITSKADGDETDADGISDMSVELKWRFHENDGLSLALKPGLTLPTGDDEKGLGPGKVTYGVFFITTQQFEAAPVVLHLNVGYTRSENEADERKDIWHTSLAGEVEAVKDLVLVGNVGIETNPDKASDTHPAFALAGLVYSVTDYLNLDIGIKLGLNETEADYTALAGLALTF